MNQVFQGLQLPDGLILTPGVFPATVPFAALGQTIIQLLFAGVDSFDLLAVPLFSLLMSPRDAVPGYALYSATKAALDRFAEGFRFEKEKNGHVMLVYPIATRTNFFNVAGESVPIAFPVQEPSTVARAIIKGIKRDKKSVYPSFLFQVMLVIDAVFPFARVIYQLIELRKFKKWQNRNK